MFGMQTTTRIGRTLLVLAGIIGGVALFVVLPGMGRAATSLTLLPCALALLCGAAKSGTA